MSPGVHGAFPSSRAEPLYFFSPPQIKHAEGKACPECCVVLFNEARAGADAWGGVEETQRILLGFEGTEGTRSQHRAQGTKAPGASRVTVPQTSPPLTQGQKHAGGHPVTPSGRPRGSAPPCSRAKSPSHPPPPSISFYNLLILRSVLKSK